MQEMRKNREQADHVRFAVIFRNTKAICYFKPSIAPCHQSARLMNQVSNYIDPQVPSRNIFRERLGQSTGTTTDIDQVISLFQSVVDKQVSFKSTGGVKIPANGQLHSLIGGILPLEPAHTSLVGFDRVHLS